MESEWYPESVFFYFARIVDLYNTPTFWAGFPWFAMTGLLLESHKKAHNYGSEKNTPNISSFLDFCLFWDPGLGGKFAHFRLSCAPFLVFFSPWAIFGPEWSQGPPRGPPRPQNTPKMVPRPPPRTPQDPQNVCFCSVACQKNGERFPLLV